MSNSPSLTALLLDVITLFLLIFSIARGYRKGFIRSVYHLGSWVLSIFLTHFLYPYTTRFLQSYNAVGIVQRLVGQFIRLPDLTGEAADVIQALPIPDVLKIKLLENNNYEVYNLLGVTTLAEYITGYISNMIINAMAMALTFAAVFLILRIASAVIRVVDRLPGIRFLNRTLGVLSGSLLGIIRVWIFCLLLTFLGVFFPSGQIFPALTESLLTGFFYNNNLLLHSLLRIFGR